jgi:hypothetical protein
MPGAKVQCLEGQTRGPDLPEARHIEGAAVIDTTVYVVRSRSCSPCLGSDASPAPRMGRSVRAVPLLCPPEEQKFPDEEENQPTDAEGPSDQIVRTL